MSTRLGGPDTDGGLADSLTAWLGARRRGLRRRVASLYLGDWFVILLTVGAAALAGGGLAGPVGVGLALALGLSVAAAIAIATSGNPVLTVLGAGVVAAGGVLTAATLALIALLGLESGVTGLVWGFGLACLAMAATGAFLTPVRTVTTRSITRTVTMAALASAGVLGVLALRVLPRAELRGRAVEAAVAVGGAGVEAVLATSDATAVPTFLLTVGVTALALRGAQTRLPTERLLPADKRAAAAAVLARSRLWLTRTARGGFLLGAAAGAATLVVSEPSTADGALAYVTYLRLDGLSGALPGPLGGLAVGLLGSTAVRVVLLSLTAVGAGVTVAVVAGRRLRRGLGWLLVRLAAPVAGGVVFGTAAGTALEDPSLPARLAAAAPEAVPTSVVLLLADLPLFAAANLLLLAAMAVFVQVLVGLALLRWLLVLPERAGSAALASVGLFGVAAVAVVVGRVPLGLGVTVVALSVWDVGEFRTGLGEDLPATAPTLRVEVVHATSSLVVAAVAAAASWAAFAFLVPLVSPADPRVAGAGLVVITLVAGLLLTTVSG